MPNNFNTVPKRNERVLAKLNYKCPFCKSEDMNKETVTCNRCGTSSPGLSAPRRRIKKKEVDAVQQSTN